MKGDIYKIGYWSGLIAFVSTVLYVIVQLMQILGVLSFPYDGILIFGSSLCIVFPFVLAVLALHYITPAEKKFWSHGALVFAVLYSVFVTANYVVQLATVIPLKLKGELGAASILDQTPHSLFWDFDALGYIFMGLVTLMAIPALEKRGFARWVRISFIAHALVTPLITFVYFYPFFSEKLLMIGLPWAITAPWAMLMLALLFKKSRNYNMAVDEH